MESTFWKNRLFNKENNKNERSLSRPVAAGLIVWFLTMTAVPIAIWTVGEASISLTMFLATIAQAALVLLVLREGWGWPAALQTALAVAALGWLAEWIGSNSGWPFGLYHYTDRLQPQIAHVPLLVPLAWFMMLPVCWSMAEMITGRTRGWRFVATAAAAMTAWDLFLDPQMVNWGFWLWDNPPTFSYFGIPWLNFGGWFLVSAVITLIMRPRSLRPGRQPLLLIYLIVWLMQTGGLALFWGLPGPAAVGFGGMGLFVTLAFWSQRT